MHNPQSLPEDQCIFNQRALPFSAAQIFAAHEDPSLLQQWWGPKGFRNTFELFEFKNGGRWNFVMHGPDGKDYQNISHFEDIVPNKSLVVAHDCAPFFRLFIAFETQSTGTLIQWCQAFESKAIRDEIAKYSAGCNEENFDRLQALLTRIN